MRNARLVDGTGAPARSGLAIVVIGGRIVDIAPDVSVPDLPVLDAQGATVIPGLMNMHVHFHFAPGQAQRGVSREMARARSDPAAGRSHWEALRGDSEEVLRNLNRAHLPAYLASGVTTVLDAATQVPVAGEIRELLAEGVPGPRVLTLGPAFTCPGGYAEIDYKGVSTVEEVEQRLDIVQSLGAVGIKVMLERGFTPLGSTWPLPSAGILDAIANGAKRRQLPIYVHATDEEEYRAALNMGAHAIMHAPLSFLWGGTLSRPLIERLADTGTYVVTTLSLMEAATIGHHRERLEDPLVQLTVPPAELATAHDPDADRFAARATIGYGPRWIPEFLVDVIARLVWNERMILNAVNRSQIMIRRLHAAGVPIVIGTDTPGTDYYQYNFHGPTTLTEIALVAAAGLSPRQALAAATRIPAAMIGSSEDLGTVEIGKKADMVVLDGDPLEDLGALRRIRWTIKEGVAHSPEDWMRVTSGHPQVRRPTDACSRPT